MRLQRATELERPEEDIPDALVDFFEANVLAMQWTEIVWCSSKAKARMRFIYFRVYIARLRLALCIHCLALLLAPFTWPAGATKLTDDSVASSQNAKLKSLYEAHQWFELRDAIQPTMAPAFYLGVVASAFNDVKLAEKYLQAVIKSAPQSVEAFDARELLIYVYMRSGRFRQAYSEVEKALAVKPDDLDLKNALALFGAISQYPEQSIRERLSSRMHFSMKGGNLFIPVELNGKSAQYIVDTGANFSILGEAEAKRLGLIIHGSGGSKMHDSTGTNVDVRVAVADQLVIGSMRLSNVIFFVARDDQQPFVDLPSGERGVLGLPVLLAVQTLRWKKEGTFEVGFAPGSSRSPKSNICFEGANLIIEGEFRQNRIHVFLDTGATRTRVLPLFAKEFSSYIEEFGRKGSDRVTGVGNSIEIDAITLPELAIRIRDFDAVLRPVQVLMVDTTSHSRWWHVWGGLDLFNHANVVTLDLGSMALALE